MISVKVNKISLENHEINAIGLKELLSDINLWGKKENNIHEGYKRKVVKRNGKLFTVLTKEVND